MIEKFFEYNPYSLAKNKKEELLLSHELELTKIHYERCEKYRNILDGLGYEPKMIKCLADLPFIPVRLFKEFELKSIPDNEVFKVISSSGTTGQVVSKIYLDQKTALLQQKVLIKILSDFVGKQRLPMLLIDSPAIIRDRTAFSARGAALMSLNILATKMTYVLNDDMSLNEAVMKSFLKENNGKKFLIFGFTFMLWQYFYKGLAESKNKYDLSKAFMIQSGGWKKFEAEKISKEDFQHKFKEICGIDHFVDHYGMAEQTGCVYADCECKNMHASIYSDIIVRSPKDFSPCKIGEKGIIQVISSLPYSYPGHSILTEDEGVILGEDDCPCGRKGKYIKVLGRIKKAELRGCSDTYVSQFR